MRSLSSISSTILRTTPLSPGPFPTPDPFLFAVYHNDAYPPALDDTMEAPRRGNGNDFDPEAPYRMYHGEKIPGFPQHPHRGFETITATVDGIIDHSDSLGNGGRYGMGDVQWMTAGKGIVHGEMFPLVHKDKPNHTRFFQIWLNLPKRNKMVEPNFAMFWKDDVPKYATDDGSATATVFYGDYFLSPRKKKDGDDNNDDDNNDTCETTNDKGQRRTRNPNAPPERSWAADPENDVAVLHLTVRPGGRITVPAAHAKKEANRALYLLGGVDDGGVLKLNDEETACQSPTMWTVDASQPLKISLSADAGNDRDFLLLQGRPIAEPVVQHGPFVMNTQEEIYQAFADYRKTQFGGWPWKKDDMVFPRDKGRFALLYGKETTPPTE